MVLFSRVLASACAFFSPSGCSALTGGFSKVMTATPPSISRVAVGGEAMLEEKLSTKGKKEMAKSEEASDSDSQGNLDLDQKEQSQNK